MFEVNQKLWYVPYQKYHGSPRGVTIEKIGRKWITLSNGQRCDKDGNVDGGEHMSLGKCYLDRELYDNQLARENVWKIIRDFIDYNRQSPESLTIENLVEIAFKLGIAIVQS